jgi:hypothetical protein
LPTLSSHPGPCLRALRARAALAPVRLPSARAARAGKQRFLRRFGLHLFDEGAGILRRVCWREGQCGVGEVGGQAGGRRGRARAARGWRVSSLGAGWRGAALKVGYVGKKDGEDSSFVGGARGEGVHSMVGTVKTSLVMFVVKSFHSRNRQTRECHSALAAGLIVGGHQPGPSRLGKLVGPSTHLQHQSIETNRSLDPPSTSINSPSIKNVATSSSLCLCVSIQF